jgi:hypothetical protein
MTTYARIATSSSEGDGRAQFVEFPRHVVSSSEQYHAPTPTKVLVANARGYCNAELNRLPDHQHWFDRQDFALGIWPVRNIRKSTRRSSIAAYI